MTDFPVNEAKMFSDNAIIARIAKEAGVFDTLVGGTSLAHAVSAVLHRKHPTHWLLFGCITGMTDKAENGLTLSALPKSRFTEAKATQMLNDMVASTQPQDGAPPR